MAVDELRTGIFVLTASYFCNVNGPESYGEAVHWQNFEKFRVHCLTKISKHPY